MSNVVQANITNRQFNVRVPDHVRDVLSRIATRLREDPRFVDQLQGLLDTADDTTAGPSLAERVAAIEARLNAMEAGAARQEPERGFALADVLKAKEEAAAQAAATDEENDHKLQYSNAAEREANRLGMIAAFLRMGLTVEELRQGVYLVAGKFEVTANRRWRRATGKSRTWYWWSKVEQFRDGEFTSLKDLEKGSKE